MPPAKSATDSDRVGFGIFSADGGAIMGAEALISGLIGARVPSDLGIKIGAGPEGDASC